MEYYIDATMVAKICKVSRSKAYAIIQKLNNELKEANYIVISGKVPTAYFMERMNLNKEVTLCR